MKSFKITLYGSHTFKKGDVVNTTDCWVVIIKTYPFNWWRKLLEFLGLPYTKENVIKVKYYIDEQRTNIRNNNA